MSVEKAFLNFPTLMTDRLILREVRLSDAEPMFTYFSDHEVMKYYGSKPHATLEDTQAWVTRMTKRYMAQQGIRWIVTFKTTDIAVGSVSFHQFDPDYTRVEVGYDLHPDHWGTGVMREAVTAVLDYGFNEMNLHRIEATIDDDNSRSKGLLLRLGFQFEGCLRGRFFGEGVFLDDYIYGLLRSEWAEHAKTLKRAQK